MPLTTSFPSLSFHVFTIQSPDVIPITLPGLKRPSSLALRLLETSELASSKSEEEEKKVDTDTLTHDLVVAAARSTLASGQVMPAEYLSITPGTIQPSTFDLLGKYLMSGSTAHVNSVSKCMDMIRMCKTYGLCQDVLCMRIMTALKDMVQVGDVMPVISCVGDIVETLNDQGVSNFCFEPRDSFFLDLALDKADEIFNDNVSRDTVLKTPLIAMLFLSRIPAAYVAKLPKVEEPAEEEE